MCKIGAGIGGSWFPVGSFHAPIEYTIQSCFVAVLLEYPKANGARFYKDTKLCHAMIGMTGWDSDQSSISCILNKKGKYKLLCR